MSSSFFSFIIRSGSEHLHQQHNAWIVSNTTARPRCVPKPRDPIIIPAIAVADFKVTQLQTLLRLIQGQDIDGEEGMLAPLEFEFALRPTMNATGGAKIFVDRVAETHLVVVDLGSSLGRD